MIAFAEEQVGERANILIVDDDESTCKSLRLILGRKGYDTETVGTGHEALERVQERQFNVAFLDIKLPDMEGLELLLPLRGLYPEIAVIIVTGYASVESAVRALKEGACGYVTKPLNVDEVLATVRGALERQRLIEQKRQADAEIRKLSSAVEQSIDGIAIGDLEPRLRYVNAAFARMHGYTAAEMVGMRIVDLRSEDQMDGYESGLNQIRTEGSWTGEIWHVRKDGTSFPTYTSVTLLQDGEGEPVGILAVARDITERKRAEQERQQLEEQLRQSQKMNAIGELAGGIAHDFNNLLTAILGYADILKLDAEPGSRSYHATKTIENAAERGAQLTQQLLGFARKGKLQNIPVDLHGVIREIVGLLCRTIDKNINITQHLEAENALVMGDPNQMHQVILNLALNARDAMPQGGELAFQTTIVEFDEECCRMYPRATPGHHLMVTVTDTGCGIPKENRDRVFEPFFSTKDGGRGTGMGLATVYGIIRNHGGIIHVYSEVGWGSTFKVYLPLAAGVSPPLTDAEPVKTVPGIGRILLVDDEETVRSVASDMLRKLGYEVVTASNGKEGIDYYYEHSNEIALVIIDMVMPEMDGRQCYRNLKRINPTVRAILSTGYSLNTRAQEIMNEGMLGFVQKPYRMNQLSSAVRSALSDDSL